MPDMNGFELSSEIKSIDNKIKVLFLTALRDLHDYDDFKSDVSPKLHQRHFIQKPVNDDDFLGQVYCILYYIISSFIAIVAFRNFKALVSLLYRPRDSWLSSTRKEDKHR